MPANTRSARLLEKLGFEKEGFARRYLYINGRWEDHVLTSLINPNGADRVIDSDEQTSL
jgi:ribosomal-protein-alanine N-acetyltransferase